MKIIKSEEEYKITIKRAIEIFHAEPGTPEDDELGLLIILIKDFEDKNYPMPEFDLNGNFNKKR